MTDVSLTPAFAFDTTAYAASVANSVTSVTVTPTPNDTGASVAYLDATNTAIADADNDSSNGNQVSLAEGENTIKVEVTAADGSTTETYTVTVTRAVGPPGSCGSPPAGQTEIWCTVMTVGTDNKTGFVKGNSVGSLGDENFEIDGTTYTVAAIYASSYWELNFEVTSGGTATDLPEDDDLTLQLKNKTAFGYYAFALKDDSDTSTGSYGTGYDSSGTAGGTQLPSGQVHGDTVVVRLLSGTAAPALSTATVNGASLVLTYDEALDTGSVPAATAYTVSVGGTAVTLAGRQPRGGERDDGDADAGGRRCAAGDTVTVTYTAPTTNPVQDAADNGVAALTNRAVTNNTPAAGPPADCGSPPAGQTEIWCTAMTAGNVAGALTGYAASYRTALSAASTTTISRSAARPTLLLHCNLRPATSWNFS